MHSKKITSTILLTFLSIFILIPGKTFAEDTTPQQTDPVTTITEAPQVSPSTSVTKTEELRPTRNPSEIRPILQRQKEELQKKLEQQKKELQTKMQENRQQILNEMQQKRKEMQDEFHASREAFMKKMQDIKDQNKQKILEKLDTLMNDVNKRQTTSMSAVLDKLTSILDEMAKKAAAAKTAGADTTSFDSAMTAARAAIEDARKAISTQSEKQYIPTITTEDALKTTVGTTRKQMETDLSSTRDTVKKAKEAVFAVAQELRKIRKDNEDKISHPPVSITISITTTPQTTATEVPSPTQ